MMKAGPLKPSQKLSTGCPVLDAFFHGGIPTSHITEIVSESGAGKTQFCLQLSLHSPSLFIHSEFPFPLSRLTRLSQNYSKIPILNIPSLPITISHNANESIPKPVSEISQNNIAKHPISVTNSISPLSSIPQNDSLDKPYSNSIQTLLKPVMDNYNPLDFVFVRPVYTAHELLELLSNLDTILQNSPFKLIIVDSIAALFRSDFECTGGDMKKRASLFFKISGKLKEIACKFSVAVVVTNQVVDVMENGKNGLRIGNFGKLISSGREVSPALGLSWANCVNSRIFLSRDEQEDKRRLHVVFSPYLPKSTCEYVITGDGVFGVDSNAMVSRKIQ